jgi:hypothetical protein
LGFIGVEHGQRSPRHHHEGRVALVEERQIAQGVDPPCAAWTPVRLPCWVEHEVIDDELATTVEKIPETSLAIRAIEDIVLVDLHHGKTPSLGVHAVVVLELGFFVAEKRLALDEPVVPQHDRGMGDLVFCVGHVI